jgi:hypothetical protein
MTSKKRKLEEESKAPALDSKEHLEACFKGLLVAACQDPKGFCHIGNLKPDGCLEIVDPQVAQQTYPLPASLHWSVIRLAGGILEMARDARTSPDNVQVFNFDKLELIVSNGMMTVMDLRSRDLPPGGFELAKKGLLNLPPVKGILHFKIGDNPAVSIASLK